jgi:hypothetical protein
MSPSPNSSSSATTPTDPFQDAVQNAEPGEPPYIEASRPMLTALANRDYASLYGMLSSHALNKVRGDQFGPEQGNAETAAPVLSNLSQEQFLEWMGIMEKRLGVPHSVRNVHVESIDPKVLSGKVDKLEDKLDVMFAIGGMPAEIPAAIRKASVRAQLHCRFSDEDAKRLASELGITEEQVQSGKWPENDKSHDPDERPYLTFKMVLVDDQGTLKIGYFEFLPPSMFD